MATGVRTGRGRRGEGEPKGPSDGRSTLICPRCPSSGSSTAGGVERPNKDASERSTSLRGTGMGRGGDPVL